MYFQIIAKPSAPFTHRQIDGIDFCSSPWIHQCSHDDIPSTTTLGKTKANAFPSGQIHLLPALYLAPIPPRLASHVYPVIQLPRQIPFIF